MKLWPRNFRDYSHWIAALFMVLGGFSFDANRVLMDQTGLPQRLVLGLDGISYDDVKAAQAKGLFKDFHPVSRLISTYPSLSDSAWAEIFGTVPPKNFQRYHYNEKANRVVGNAFSDLTNPVEYERRMHVTFNSMVHHLMSYINSYKSAVGELNDIVDGYLRSKSVEQFFAYSVSTDSFQHAAGGEIDDYLLLLDSKLDLLRDIYRRTTGHDLEIIIVSDHGNNHAHRATPFPLRENLSAAGFKESFSIQNETDYVLAQSGTLTALVMFAHRKRWRDLAETLAQMEGVDLVSYMDPDHRQKIQLITAGGERAEITAQAEKGLYRLRPLKGDPLGYRSVLDLMKKDLVLNASGYAHEKDWLKHTAEHAYPMAVDRIWRGHHANTLNHPHILVSLKDGYEFAFGITGVLTEMNLNNWGGSHGSLNANSSNGIVMATSKKTQDMPTRFVQEFFDGFFPHLRDYRREESGGRFVNSVTLPFYVNADNLIGDPNLEANRKLGYLDFWDPQTKPMWLEGVKTEYRFVLEKVQKQGTIERSQIIKELVRDAEMLMRTRDGLEFLFPLSELFERAPKVDESYRVRVIAKRFLLPSKSILTQTPVFSQAVEFNKDGILIAFD